GLRRHRRPGRPRRHPRHRAPEPAGAGIPPTPPRRTGRARPAEKEERSGEGREGAPRPPGAARARVGGAEGTGADAGGGERRQWVDRETWARAPPLFTPPGQERAPRL